MRETARETVRAGSEIRMGMSVHCDVLLFRKGFCFNLLLISCGLSLISIRCPSLASSFPSTSSLRSSSNFRILSFDTNSAALAAFVSSHLSSRHVTPRHVKSRQSSPSRSGVCLTPHRSRRHRLRVQAQIFAFHPSIPALPRSSRPLPISRHATLRYATPSHANPPPRAPAFALCHKRYSKTLHSEDFVHD